MIENLDMDGLRAFVAIADTMSFSRAGDAIGRSQPTVSLRLRNLERSIGVSLLIRRQGRVIALTADGRTLLGYARQIIDMNDQALRGLSGSQARLRLGLPADFVDFGLGQAIGKCQALFPGLRLDVETDVSGTLHGRCLAGDLDIAFYKGMGDDGGRYLRHVPLCWAKGRGTEDTADEVRLAAFPEGCAYRRRMVEVLDLAGRPHRVVLTTPSEHSLRQAVATGLAVTALPESLIDADDRLVRVDGLPPLGSVMLALMLAPSHSPQIDRVAECLCGHLR
mgnify:CR=1 FL=1